MTLLITGFVLGGLLFSVVLLFVIGATRGEKENEIYKQGFKDGYEGRWGTGSYEDDGK